MHFEPRNRHREFTRSETHLMFFHVQATNVGNVDQVAPVNPEELVSLFFQLTQRHINRNPPVVSGIHKRSMGIIRIALEAEDVIYIDLHDFIVAPQGNCPPPVRHF